MGSYGCAAPAAIADVNRGAPLIRFGAGDSYHTTQHPPPNGAVMTMGGGMILP
jgi:hypothetical protein